MVYSRSRLNCLENLKTAFRTVEGALPELINYSLDYAFVNCIERIDNGLNVSLPAAKTHHEMLSLKRDLYCLQYNTGAFQICICSFSTRKVLG